jgi:hypothetical protein
MVGGDQKVNLLRPDSIHGPGIVTMKNLTRELVFQFAGLGIQGTKRFGAVDLRPRNPSVGGKDFGVIVITADPADIMQNEGEIKVLKNRSVTTAQDILKVLSLVVTDPAHIRI